MNRDLHKRHLDASWREAIRIEFQQQVLASASEFPASLSPKEKRIRDIAIDFLAKETGVSGGVRVERADRGGA